MLVLVSDTQHDPLVGFVQNAAFIHFRNEFKYLADKTQEFRESVHLSHQTLLFLLYETMKWKISQSELLLM